MAKKKDENKYIPTKNYVIAIIFSTVVVLTIWYIFSWLDVKKKSMLLDSYLLSTNTLSLEITSLKEAKQVFTESPMEYFVYISYTNNEDILALEKKLKKIIDNYELHDQFYYVNVTNDLKNEKLYTNLNDAFNTTRISNVPCILYYKNDVLDTIIGNEKGIFSHKEFEKLLKENEYES